MMTTTTKMAAKAITTMPARAATITLMLGAALLAGCATPRLETPAGETEAMTVAAHGVQIYECRAMPAAPGTTSEASVPAWAFVAPEAELFDTDGRRIGQHGAGPVWRHDDGSGFKGTVRAKVDAPRPGAIPWLLLTAQAQGLDGAFSRVSSVQRRDTVGGQPPADGCGPATLGARVRMAYRADYVLFVPGR